VHDRQLEHAAEWQRNRLPRIKPLLNGWEVAGWNTQADALGGDFYDWIVLPNGSLAVTLGDAQGKMSEAALTASTVHTAVRSHADYRHSAQSLVRRVNETLWTASVGDQFASLFYGTIQPETGEFEYAMAGHVYGAIIGERPRPFSAPDELPLGTQPDSEVTGYEDRIGRGELLVLISEGVYQLLRPSRCRVLWRMLQAHRELSVDQLLEKACTFLRRQEHGPNGEDMTILIVKRS
jgi:sigma-B regulation protein RsbU (phosphoserine phosphatase)